MKKKILIGTVNMEIGGIEKTLINLLNAIDYNKYVIDLLLLKTNGDLMTEINENVNIITPYKSRLLKSICNSKNPICKLIKHILFNYNTGFLWTNKNKSYDVAISYSGYYPFIDKYIAKTKAKKKLIWVHTDLKKVYDTDILYRERIKLTKNKYNCFDKIICVSASIKEEFIKFFKVDPKKVLVQWNLINLTKNNNKYPKLNGNIKLISVGRLCYIKRFDKLIEIHKKLLESNYNVTTYLVGSGEEEKKLKELIKKNKLTQSFIMLGNQKNVIEIIKQADLFVSTSDYEGLPTVLLETLCAHVPFVAPNVSGIKDIAKFIAPKNSYILTNNSIDDLYKGIIKMLEKNNKNNFEFEIETYNKKCLESFYDIIK